MIDKCKKEENKIIKENFKGKLIIPKSKISKIFLTIFLQLKFHLKYILHIFLFLS